MKYLISISLFLFSFQLFAEEIKIFQINYPTKGVFVDYYIDKENCDFKPQTLRVKINNEKPSLLADFYYGFTLVSEKKNELVFYLNSAKNIQFIYRKINSCAFSLFAKVDDRERELKGIYLEYYNRLYFPTLKSINLDFSNGETLALEPQDAEGYLPFYELYFGVGSIINTDIRGDNQKFIHGGGVNMEPIPAVFVRYGPFFLNHTGLGSLFLKWNKLLVLGIILRDGEPYESKNKHIRERTNANFFGLMVEFDFLNVQYIKDIFFDHGAVFKASIAPTFHPNARWTIKPVFSVHHWNEKYINYYFGVNEREALATGKSRYKPRHSYQYALMVENYLKYKEWQFITSIGMKSYGKEVSQSPISETDKELKLVLGFLYKIL